GNEPARPGEPVPNGTTLEPARARKTQQWKIGRSGHADLSIRSGNSALRCRNIRTPLQQIRRQSRRDNRRWSAPGSRGNAETRSRLPNQHRNRVFELRSLKLYVDGLRARGL